ncbi:hypothetical protein BG011_006860 [Mortierella polycephala]|uniref:CUE domain-containing protein n=1 Tax=Mortierella polycephala TaxID=41804 RepID=A0A9P6PU93_9FUNG|nr:hypothetical protein BG011_006860 [Mortierella polycephala]
MASPAVDILPFVTPVIDQTLTEVEFSVAVDDWNDALSRILKHNNKAFWTEILQNTSLARFLNSFLGEYATFRGGEGDIWVMELREVVRRVLMIYRRIAETISGQDASAVSGSLLEDQDCSDPGSALLDLGIISTSVLMDLAGIYGSSDPEGVSKIISSLLQNAPGLINDFRTSTGTVVQIVRRVQKRFEKGVNGGTGKGKGKGKGVSPAMSPEPGLSELDQGKITEAMQYAGALSNISYALDAVSAASPLLASELQQHPLFLECLISCYNYTLPALSKTLLDNQVGGQAKAQPILESLRQRMLSIVNNILKGICKQHRPLTGHNDALGVDTLAELDEDASAALTDSLCRVIIDLYEESPLQEHMTPMLDAPMVLDLEIQFSISDMLKGIIAEVFKGENDRLSHWVVRLHDLREFNPATQSFVYEHNMRKSEKMAREMSSIYINQDRGRSGSTIISDVNEQHIQVGPMSVDQEEDYVKRTLLISQLQDLFPDLGDGFLEACLLTYKDDPEMVTMQLLEENLSSDLAVMDRSTARSLPHRVEPAPTSMALVKISNPEEHEEHDLLSTRKNIFDGDAFDVFSGNVVDKSKVSRGKTGPEDAAVILDDKTFVAQHKSAILQAVDTMYDDEYDDTYDSMGLNSTGADFKMVDDVNLNTDEGVTKNTTGRAQMIDPSVEHEEVLINMYMGQKEVFNRSTEARRSKKRQELRNLTKMSDEQLEGWAIMFGRNPRKAEIAQKYEFSGRQTEIERAEPTDKRRGGRLPMGDRNPASNKPQQQQQRASPSEKKPQAPKPPRQQQGKDGAHSSQPQPQPQSQSQSQQQQQKRTNQPGGPSAQNKAKNERQKASKANHNRRNQHAKKMASMNP